MTSATALDEFRARTSDFEDELELVSLAARLRPRLGGVLNYDAKGEDLSLALQFVAHKNDRPEGILAALMVRLLAAFERFVRRRIAECVRTHQARAKTYDELPDHLRQRNMVLSGRALSMLDTAPDHLLIDSDQLLGALASCRPGAATFELSARAFEIAVTGASPEAVQRALESVGVKDWLDKVGADAHVAVTVETKPTQVRETAKRVKEELERLSRWRNNVAHAGDVEVLVDEGLLRKKIVFLSALAVAIDAACS